MEETEPREPAETERADAAEPVHADPEVEPDPEIEVEPDPEVEAVERRRRAVALGILALLLAVVAAVAIGWWRSSPAPPTELLDLRSEEVTGEPADLEQLAFEQRRAAASEPGPASSGGPSAGERSLTDHAWVERLAGRWLLDFGNRQVPVTFGAALARRVSGSRLDLELFPVDGLGLPPFYTVLKRSEDESFLAFQDVDGRYTGLLDDLRSHSADLISYRLGGTDRRVYGHRFGELGDSARPFGPPGSELYDPRGDPEPDDDRAPLGADGERGPEPIEITVERRSPEELWRRAEALEDAGRLESLERALERVLAADPDHRRARRKLRNLPRRRARQERNLREDLQDRLEDLEDAIEDQDLDDLVELWTPGARPATETFFRRFFDRHESTRVRRQVTGREVQDGVLIFDVVLTLEGSDGRGRSFETHPWRGRLYDDRFLDPFPGS